MPSLPPSLKAGLPSRGSERMFSGLGGLLGLCTVLPNWARKSQWTEEIKAKADRVKNGVNEEQNTAHPLEVKTESSCLSQPCL